jgi:hypothetical protein
MTRTVSAISGVLAALFSAQLNAQWLNYPTPGLPRTANGKMNTAAPVPRTADGKPDFSGLWEAPPRAGRAAAQDAKRAEVIGSDIALGGSGDLGSFVKGGLPYSPWGAELLKARHANEDKDDPDGYCQPLGLVRMQKIEGPRKIVQVPGLLVILFERDNVFRQIFLDGRPMPVDPQPAFNGYSIGKWEGDTLVVQSAGFKDGMWLDNIGSPFTAGARVTERFRRPSFGNLEIEVSVDDPKAYTKPWTYTVHQVIASDTEIMEFFCTENNRDSAHLVGK